MHKLTFIGNKICQKEQLQWASMAIVNHMYPVEDADPQVTISSIKVAQGVDTDTVPNCVPLPGRKKA